jgi:hypothetical protein
MRDSNWSLRWNHTAREAYGHDVEFDSSYNEFDKFVIWVTLFAIGFIAGVLLS